jgi:hypothetical protein
MRSTIAAIWRVGEGFCEIRRRLGAIVDAVVARSHVVQRRAIMVMMVR